MKKKYYLWKIFKVTNPGRDHEEYKKERNSLRDLTRKLQNDCEKYLINKLKRKDPKALWKYTNNKLKTTCTISQLTKQYGTSIPTEDQQAQVQNDFFCSVFTEEM